ncbi:hypothetical protein BSKO_05228 [Bryopsis sp. KO-2023]|nr:hypothetical protein BSKO_05228 [Bryopsis sp. KO-2023]
MFLRWKNEHDEGGGSDGAIALLEKLEAALKRLVEEDHSHVSELRFLLMNSLSKVRPPRPIDNWLWLRSFVSDGENEAEKAIKSDLLKMCLERAPRMVGEFLSRHPKIVRGFFREDPSRIPQWFSHFSSEGLSKFRWGAKALATFSLAKRDRVWEFLVWGGRHSQAPVAVATKLHYFYELKVKDTVENLLNECPEFWSSDEFRNCLRSGDILSLDPNFFVEELYDDWTGRDGEVVAEIEEIIETVVKEMETCEWIHRIEIHLSEQEVMALLKSIASDLRRDQTGQESVFNAMFSIRWKRFGDALLANALAFNPAALLGFLKANDELQERISKNSMQLHTSPDIHKDQCHLLKKTIDALPRDKEFTFRWLEVFSMEIALSKCVEQGGVEALDSILSDNGIEVRSSSPRKKYALLTSSDDDQKKSSRKRKKKHKKRESKRKKLMDDLTRNSSGTLSGRVWQLTSFRSGKVSMLECNGQREVIQALVDHAKYYWCPEGMDGPSHL